MSETISSKSTAEQLDSCRIKNYNPSFDELEDEADIAIARQRLEEIRKDPSRLLRGEELRESMAVWRW